MGVGAYLSLTGNGREVGWGLGAYSRLGAYYLFLPLGWALIRGWVLIRINTDMHMDMIWIASLTTWNFITVQSNR